MFQNIYSCKWRGGGGVRANVKNYLCRCKTATAFIKKCKKMKWKFHSHHVFPLLVAYSSILCRVNMSMYITWASSWEGNKFITLMYTLGWNSDRNQEVTQQTKHWNYSGEEEEKEGVTFLISTLPYTIVFIRTNSFKINPKYIFYSILHGYCLAFWHCK